MVVPIDKTSFDDFLSYNMMTRRSNGRYLDKIDTSPPMCLRWVVLITIKSYTSGACPGTNRRYSFVSLQRTHVREIPLSKVFMKLCTRRVKGLVDARNRERCPCV